MYTSIKPSCDPVHPSCPIHALPRKAKGQKQLSSLPSQAALHSGVFPPEARALCSAALCRRWCRACSSVPSQQAELTYACQSHVPESFSASARLQQPSSCPCCLVQGHSVSIPLKTAHKGHTSQPVRRCTSPGSWASSHRCHWQCCLQCPHTGPPESRSSPGHHGTAVPRSEQALLQDGVPVLEQACPQVEAGSVDH